MNSSNILNNANLFKAHAYKALPAVAMMMVLGIGLTGCKQVDVPTIPTILKDKVELSSGTYADNQPKRLSYSEQREPCAVYNPLRNPYFGDTHVHTERSLDAGIQDTRTTPAQAYEFAKGKPLGIQPWLDETTPSRTVQLGRALDFAMVSDHAEFFGEAAVCSDPGVDPAAYASEKCEKFRADPRGNFVSWNLQYLGSLIQPNKALGRFDFCGENGKKCLDASTSVWQEIREAAEAAYDKSSACEFSAFVGYEYTAAPVSFNLHRNVVFRNADVPLQPLSYMEFSKPENLWKGLEQYCNDQHNCESLTIPHNANMSGDFMFRREKTTLAFTDFTPDYVALRQKYEPLFEIIQHKGDSECVRSADEHCGFEKFPFNNLIADRYAGYLTGEPNEASFLRYALGEGMNLERELGTNPFKYGVIGSTDTHLGTPGLVNESNYPGHGGAGADNGAPGEPLEPGLTDLISFSPGGLAVLWAEENSRDYLFDAMQRKETHATSGPRVLVRMYGGWEYEEAAICNGFAYDPSGEALKRGPFPTLGDAGGVPMGSDLQRTGAGSGAPTFAVAAIKDPGYDGPGSAIDEPSQRLQKIQIVKVWVDAAGTKHERVFDVAGESSTRVNDTGVDLNTCAVTSSAGHDALCRVWKDPEFNAANDAAYYARVLEQPSCRWSWQQCLAYQKESGLESFEAACAEPSTLPKGYEQCCLHEHLQDSYPNTFKKQQIGTYSATLQERAWTSPIWYRAN